MPSERGITLVELVIVVAVASIFLVAAASYSVPMMAKETMRSAVYDFQTYMQLARMEAVGRNHACRFVIDAGKRELFVVDTRGTPTLSDDEILYDTTVADSVVFARPASGTPITLGSVTGKIFQTTFASNGTVTSGAGDVYLMGGDRYGRISVHAAGGIEVSRWDGSSWKSGS
jgi:prepilin-type N-terminal cleavage/methylation domain-containing protein